MHHLLALFKDFITWYLRTAASSDAAFSEFLRSWFQTASVGAGWRWSCCGCVIAQGFSESKPQIWLYESTTTFACCTCLRFLAKVSQGAREGGSGGGRRGGGTNVNSCSQWVKGEKVCSRESNSEGTTWLYLYCSEKLSDPTLDLMISTEMKLNLRCVMLYLITGFATELHGFNQYEGLSVRRFFFSTFKL